MNYLDRVGTAMVLNIGGLLGEEQEEPPMRALLGEERKDEPEQKSEPC